jgi:flagellin
MPARINHNVHLKQVHRNLALHSAESAKQIGQLASGRRVARSSDDPASLALANGIKSEIAALSEGTRNVQQSISMLQVADGAMSEINNMIRRMSNLAAQSANFTYNDSDRRSINQEFQQLKQEIDRIAESTTYNGIGLLKEPNVFTIQVGPTETSNDISRVSLDDMRASGPKLGIGTTSINTTNDAKAAITKMEHALNLVIAERNRIGAFQSRLEMAVNTSARVIERMTDSESSIRDVDLAKSVTALSNSQILAQTATRFAIEADLDIERVLSLLR